MSDWPWVAEFKPARSGYDKPSPFFDERWENVYGEIKDLDNDPLSMPLEKGFIRLRLCVEYQRDIWYTTFLLDKEDHDFIRDPDGTIRWLLTKMVEELDRRLEGRKK